MSAGAFDQDHSAALRDMQQLLGGRYSVAVVAAACCDLLVQTVGVLQDSPEACDFLLDELVEDCRRVLRENWTELQAARRLMLEMPRGRA